MLAGSVKCPQRPVTENRILLIIQKEMSLTKQVKNHLEENKIVVKVVC